LPDEFFATFTRCRQAAGIDPTLVPVHDRKLARSEAHNQSSAMICLIRSGRCPFAGHVEGRAIPDPRWCERSNEMAVTGR